MSPASLLAELAPGHWLALTLALLLFVGPGVAGLSLFPGRDRIDRPQAAALAVVLALAFWAVLLAWLQAFQLWLGPLAAAAVLGAGWLVGLVRLLRDRRRAARGVRGQPGGLSEVGLWAGLAVTVVVSVLALRQAYAGLGSDSYPHSLIAQLIVERGGLPGSYLPYAPLVTFRYHFAFHALAAALMWLTGLSARLVTPLAGQLLMPAAALSVGFFAATATRRRGVAAYSVALAGLVAVFPAYFVNWGRYTQLTGLVILPVFLGLLWGWVDERPGRAAVATVGLLAAGLAFSHYRIAVMAAVGAAVLVGWRLLVERRPWPQVRQVALALAGALGVAALLVVPWLWHLWGTRHTGYPIVLQPVTSSAYFSIERLGPGALAFPTNAALVALTAVAVGLGWWWRDPVIRPLSVWAAVLWVASAPQLLGGNMDTVTVFTSFFFPAAVVVGTMLVRLTEQGAARWRVARLAAPALVVAVAAVGAFAITRVHEAGADYVLAGDLRAAEWIRTNTPETALFMVNTFHFPFAADYVIGSDAGYWLPLLTGRVTVTAPLLYTIERSRTPDFAQQLLALSHLTADLTTEAAVQSLQGAGVTHVYLGQRGGPIAADKLLASPHFAVEYQDAPVYVFRLVAGASGE